MNSKDKGSDLKKVVPPNSKSSGSGQSKPELDDTTTSPPVKKPKRPLPPSTMWLMENREEIKKNNPKVKDANKITTIGMQIWKKLPFEETKKFGDIFQQNKLKYDDEYGRYQIYCAQEAEAKKEQQKKTVAEKPVVESTEENDEPPLEPVAKPKHPLSAYMLFVNESREKIMADHPKAKNYMQLASMEWTKLAAKKKEKFEKRAKENGEKYKEEMVDYKLQCIYLRRANVETEKGTGSEGHIVTPLIPSDSVRFCSCF